MRNGGRESERNKNKENLNEKKTETEWAQGQTDSAWLEAKISECNFINSCVFQ